MGRLGFLSWMTSKVEDGSAAFNQNEKKKKRKKREDFFHGMQGHFSATAPAAI